MSLLTLLVNLIVIVILVLVIKWIADEMGLSGRIRNIIFLLLALFLIVWFFSGGAYIRV